MAAHAAPYVGAALDAGQQRAQQSMGDFKGQMDAYLKERGLLNPQSGRVDPMHSLLQSLGNPENLSMLGRLGGAALGGYGAYRGNPYLMAGGAGLYGYADPRIRQWTGKPPPWPSAW
jgi:hypothetical protein